MSNREDAVAAMVKDALVFRDEPPRPLTRDLPPANPFPVDALGTTLHRAAVGVQATAQAPVAICAQSVLATATLAVQGHADVQLPNKQTRPLSGYFLTIAASGERKSTCDKEALWPVRKREAALHEGYQSSLMHYRNDRDAWDAARKKAFKNKDRDGIRVDLEAVGTEPVEPLSPILIAPEPTIEGLHKLLAIGQPILGVFASEAGQFVGGHGMTAEAKLKTAAGFSCLWDGEPIRRVRAGDGATMLPGRRVSMHLMAQPDVAAVMLCDRVLQDQGLLSRVLVSAPDSAMGRRFYQDMNSDGEAELRQYRARLLDILETPFPLADGTRNELQPRTLPLCAKARALWIKYANSVESALGHGGEYETIRGLANKLPEHAARIAAVLTLVDDLAAAEVSGEMMAAGITLAMHYADEALRLHMSKATDPSLIEAQKALDWCTSQQGDFVSLVEMYQRGPNAIRDATKARRAARILEEHGWLVAVPDGAEISGVFRREVWRVRRG